MAFIEGKLTTLQVGLKSHYSGSTRTNVHRIRHNSSTQTTIFCYLRPPAIVAVPGRYHVGLIEV
jgi:hypothetical protein